MIGLLWRWLFGPSQIWPESLSNRDLDEFLARGREHPDAFGQMVQGDITPDEYCA